jgi:hypothetical protein
MINPFSWLRYQRTRRAIAGYPIYDVPNKHNEGALRKEQIDENFAYFMEVRLQRLAFFRSWLSDHYGVEAPLNGDGILAIEKWADLYGVGLVANPDGSSEVFTTYQPNWTGDNRGYNVLVDIAIFLGEFLLSKHSHLHWMLLAGPDGGLCDDKEGEPIGSTKGRPAVGGYLIWTPDLFQVVYLKVVSCRSRLEIGGNHLQKSQVSFASFCRQSLHMATHTDPRAPFVFGDYSHGPL